MSQAPIMPLVTDALLGDTLHLSTEEFGAYCLLLFTTWRNNGRALPDNNKVLSRICRVSPARWRILRPVLVQFFSTEDGFWHQKRLEKEWERVLNRVEIAIKNGAAGGRPKTLKKHDPAKPNGFALGSANARANPDPDFISNLKGNLGLSAREARSAPPAADAASAVTEAPAEYVTPAEVDEIVAAALSKLNGKAVHDPTARQATIAEATRDAWLDNLATFVAEAFGGDARMQAWEHIETARAAGSRAKTPKPVRAALDEIDKLYRESQGESAA